jgi:bacterioferritin-associated ferredoxin
VESAAVIVCSCNILTDQQVLHAIASATTNRPPTVKEVYAGLRCRARCGGCAATIRKLREEACAAAAVENEVVGAAA